MSRKVTVLLFLLALANSVFSQLNNLYFPGWFDHVNNMSLNGSAAFENGILCLTNSKKSIPGQAFYSSPINFKNSSNGKAFSFSTVFVFAIVPQHPNLGGPGLAFTLSTSKEQPGAIPRQYLGHPNRTVGGNFSYHIFAVEFDARGDYDICDIKDQYVGVNGIRTHNFVPAAYFFNDSAKKGLDLISGNPIQVWVDYDSSKNLLEVSLSPSSTKPHSPMLIVNTDLSHILNDSMYIGFFASPGLATSTGYILGWSFSMNGEAMPLSQSALPSVPGPKKNHVRLIVGVSVSAAFITIWVMAGAFYVIRKIRRADVTEAWELNVAPHRFSYQELNKATKGFTDNGLLGFGGFGKVYKGTLPNSNTQVAVKRICQESKQGLREFLTEIASIGCLRHKNLVQLLGWCRHRSDLLLVYDFMENGSLDKFLFDEPKRILKWEQRFGIIEGVASGLLYLHEEWEQTVIHRDIKASNVLLDSGLNARLGDFGLAKLCERGSNPITTKVVGTLGYLAPELTRTGKPTTCSDVFAFGALLLAVVCGRRPFDFKALPEELTLVDWVWDKWRSGEILNAVDPRLNGEFDEPEAVVVLRLGLMCSNSTPGARPTMREIVRYLEGEVALPEEVPAPDL